MAEPPRNRAPTPEITPVRVVLIARDPLVRSNLAAVVQADSGLLLVGQDVPGTSAEQISSIYRPEVVLWDVGWQAEADEGWEALPQSGAAVVLLVPDSESGRSGWLGGARGVLSRDAAPAKIVAALAAAGQGLSVRDPSVIVSHEERPVPNARRPLEPLTERELDVLRQVGQGLSNKEIAVRLAISESTVKFHVNSILGKLGAQSRTEAAMLAARTGLIPL